MHSKPWFLGPLCGLLLATFGVCTAWADDKSAKVVERDIGGDRFVFGGSVRVDKPVSGDLVAAGGNVDIDAPVAGDAVVAGGNVRLNSNVGQDVYAGAGRIVIDGQVGHNLRIGGGQIELGPKAVIAGNVTIGGGQVTLRGAVKGSMQIGGGRVLIDGLVDGDVVSTAGQLELGPNAKIGGALRYRSREDLIRDPAAQVAGVVERLRLPGVGRGASAPMGPGDDDRHMGYRGWGISGGWILWTLGLMALGVLLVLALPVTSRRVAVSWRERTGWSLLLGFITLVCVPVACVMLLITIIGIPLALLLLLLYLALLLVAYVSSGIALGEWLLGRFHPDAAQRRSWRLATAALAVLALALLSAVPYLGGAVSFGAVLLGIGAIALQLAPARRPDTVG